LKPGILSTQNYYNNAYHDSILLVIEHTIQNVTDCRNDKKTGWLRQINPEVWLKKNIRHWSYDELDRITKLQTWNYNLNVRKWRYIYSQYTYDGDLLTMVKTNNTDRYYVANYSYDSNQKMISTFSWTYYYEEMLSVPSGKLKYYYDEYDRPILDSSFFFSGGFGFYPSRVTK